MNNKIDAQEIFSANLRMLKVPTGKGDDTLQTIMNAKPPPQ